MKEKEEVMKASEVQNLKTATAFLLARTREQYNGAIFVALTIVVMFILPEFIPSPFDCMVMGFGSAILLTALVLLTPASFRGRSGSLRMAIGLVTAMWIFAAVTTVISLIG